MWSVEIPKRYIVTIRACLTISCAVFNHKGHML